MTRRPAYTAQGGMIAGAFCLITPAEARVRIMSHANASIDGTAITDHQSTVLMIGDLIRAIREVEAAAIIEGPTA